MNKDWNTTISTIAYRGESKNGLKFLCLLEFQSHHPLRLLLLRVNYIQLKENGLTFADWQIKMKRILGLKLDQIQIHIIMACALRGVIKSVNVLIKNTRK